MADFTTKTSGSAAGTFGVLVIAGIIVLGLAYLVTTAGGPAETAAPLSAVPADSPSAVPATE